jgi:hypothetical protein
LLDRSIDMSAKLAAIVREDEERARAAGREPVPSPSTPPKLIPKKDPPEEDPADKDPADKDPE